MLDRTERQIMEFWKDDTPLVSIKCLTYNHQNFIAAAIEGFLSQKTSFPFEVIIHDDASTDNTANIVRDYVKRYPNIIKPIYQTENQHRKNNGVINRIINSKMRGKYVAFCEGDDYWCIDDKLEKQVDFMESHPECSMCLHNTSFHYVDNSQKDRNFNNWSEIHIMTPEEVFFGWNVHTSSYLIKRELDYKPEFSKGVWCGDYVYLTMAMHYGKVYVLPEVMSVYNANILTGVTVQNTKNGIEFAIKRQQDRVKYLEKYNVYTEYKFDEFVQARIAEISMEISDDYRELKNAAKIVSKKKWFSIICKDRNLWGRLKLQWKYRGYIFGRLWHLTILLRNRHWKKIFVTH